MSISKPMIAAGITAAAMLPLSYKMHSGALEHDRKHDTNRFRLAGMAMAPIGFIGMTSGISMHITGSVHGNAVKAIAGAGIAAATAGYLGGILGAALVPMVKESWN